MSGLVLSVFEGLSIKKFLQSEFLHLTNNKHFSRKVAFGGQFSLIQFNLAFCVYLESIKSV